MTSLWNIFAEITIEAGDFASGDTNGFMNIITWATSAEMARSRIETYFKGFNWHVIEVEDAKILDNNFVPEEDEFAEMLERARVNPEAIILGTFHSYKSS